MSEPTIYKPSVYNGNGVYKNGASGGGGGGSVPEGWKEIFAIKQTGSIEGAPFAISAKDSFINTDFNIEYIIDISGIATDSTASYFVYNGNSWDGFYNGGMFSSANMLVWGGKNGKEMNHNYANISLTDDEKNGFIKFISKNGNGTIYLAGHSLKAFYNNYSARNYKTFYLGSRYANTIWKNFRIYKDGEEPILDCIPVKNKDTGNLTFYDKVSQNLATYNANTQNNIEEYGFL